MDEMLIHQDSGKFTPWVGDMEFVAKGLPKASDSLERSLRKHHLLPRLIPVKLSQIVDKLNRQSSLKRLQ